MRLFARIASAKDAADVSTSPKCRYMGPLPASNRPLYRFAFNRSRESLLTNTLNLPQPLLVFSINRYFDKGFTVTFVGNAVMR